MRDISAFEKNEMVGLAQWAGLAWQPFIQAGGFEVVQVTLRTHS